MSVSFAHENYGLSFAIWMRHQNMILLAT